MLCRLCNENEVPEYKIKKRDYVCKKCNYTRTKPQALRYDKKKRDTLKQRIFDHYGHECAYCRSTENLEIDHVNGDGAEHRRQVGHGNNFYRSIVKDGFPNTYQTLCSKCNRAKSNMTDSEFRAWIVMLYNALQGA